jgi:hypothetical protein
MPQTLCPEGDVSGHLRLQPTAPAAAPLEPAGSLALQVGCLTGSAFRDEARGTSGIRGKLGHEDCELYVRSGCRRHSTRVTCQRMLRITKCDRSR